MSCNVGIAESSDIMSGKDVRFADYRVEVFDTTGKTDIANAALTVVTAINNVLIDAHIIE